MTMRSRVRFRPGSRGWNDIESIERAVSVYMRKSKEREMRGKIMGAGKSNDYADTYHFGQPTSC